MNLFVEKKNILLTIVGVAVAGFAINSVNNINNLTTESKPTTAVTNKLLSEPQPLRSEHQLIAADKDKKASFLSSNQNSQFSATDSTTRHAASRRDKALAEQSKCHTSSIDEVGYITEAYNQKTIDSSAANQQMLYQMQSCGMQQIGSIVNKLFADSDDVTHSMALLLDLLPQMDRALSVVLAIKQQDFSNDEMKTLIEMTKDQATGIKQALMPSIIKNDNLENLLALTQQHNFYSSVEARTGSYPTADESRQMMQNLLLSQSQNIKSDGAIFNHLLNTYPNSATQNQLTKIAFTTNQ